MRFRNIIIALALLLLCQCSVTGQNLHTRSGRALKYYDLGKRDYEMLYIDRAEINLKIAVAEDGQFYEAHILLGQLYSCLLYTSPSPRDGLLSRMPSSA